MLFCALSIATPLAILPEQINILKEGTSAKKSSNGAFAHLNLRLHNEQFFNVHLRTLLNGSDGDTVPNDGVELASKNPWLNQDESESEENDGDASVLQPKDIYSADEDPHLTSSKGHKHPFFQSSDSTLFFDCSPSDPFTTSLAEAHPLAEQHLLQPIARREDLFEIPRQPSLGSHMDVLPKKISLCSTDSHFPSTSLFPSGQELVLRDPQNPTKNESNQSYASLAQNITPIIVAALGKKDMTPEKSRLIVNAHPSRGESILLFLVQTVSRKIGEQRQYRSSCPHSTTSCKLFSATAPSFSNIDRPKFSHWALERLLNYWSAVRTMVMAGWRAELTSSSSSIVTGWNSSPFHEHQAYLNSQNGTALLDKFTHCLLVKCSTEGSEELFSVDPMLTQRQSTAAIASTGDSHQVELVAAGGPPVGSARDDEDHEVDIIEDSVDEMPKEEQSDDQAEHYNFPPGEESESDSDSNPVIASYQTIQNNANVQRSTTTGTTTGSDAGSSNLIFIDPSSLRQTTGGTISVAAAAAAAIQETSMATSAVCLTRAFGAIVHQIAELLAIVTDNTVLVPALPPTLDLSYQESAILQACLDCYLKLTCDRLATMMNDATEVGFALSNPSSLAHPSHPLHRHNRVNLEGGDVQASGSKCRGGVQGNCIVTAVKSASAA